MALICDYCEANVTEDDVCEECNAHMCCDCTCVDDETVCKECGTECGTCGLPFAGPDYCAECGEDVCPECIEDDLCSSCAYADESTEDDLDDGERPEDYLPSDAID